MKHIDTSFESFFYQRDYSLKSFNFYLQVLAQQYKSKEALDALRKMETLGLKPDDQSYNCVMTAFAKNRDIPMVEKLNQEAIDKYGLLPSIHRYNALILAHAKSGKALDSEKVLREMISKGLRPDVVCYTTVIDAYKRVRDINKCWELYEYFSTNTGLMESGPGSDTDEFMLSYMIRVCAATHDAEKGMQLFNQMETKGFIRHAMPYNSLIFALASTKRFSQKALEYWRSMHLHNVMPDKHTYVAVLKACS